MHADWHFARPLHPMSRFSEPSIWRLYRALTLLLSLPLQTVAEGFED